MVRSLIVAFAVFVRMAGLLYGQSPDFAAIRRETVEHFTSLLKIDTSNPPGNETKAALYVQAVLEREGIPAKLLTHTEGRANLVARLPGTGRKRPILIMGHTDVVGVQREKWSFDPFAAIRKDGYIYGRGALDDKDNLTAGLMVMVTLKRLGVKLDRDVIFVAEAGEEGNSLVGINFLVEKHWDQIDAEYCLAEGGGGLRRAGKPIYMTVATAEKVPRGATLISRGTAGHGSAPRLDNAVVHLAGAVARVAEWQPPMRLNDTTRAYFERLAAISTPEQARRYREIVLPGKAPAIESYFRQHDIMHNSILRTSVSPNVIKAGFRSNVIPSEAEAILDIRALPDENMEQFFQQMRRVINDPQIEVVPNPGGRPTGQPSRVDTDLFRLLEATQKKIYPGAATLPYMLTGATDMAQLRARGVQSYGVGPLVEEKDQLLGGAHGDDEKILEQSLHQFVEFLWITVREIAAVANP